MAKVLLGSAAGAVDSENAALGSDVTSMVDPEASVEVAVTLNLLDPKIKLIVSTLGYSSSLWLKDPSKDATANSDEGNSGAEKVAVTGDSNNAFCINDEKWPRTVDASLLQEKSMRKEDGIGNLGGYDTAIGSQLSSSDLHDRTVGILLPKAVSSTLATL